MKIYRTNEWKGYGKQNYYCNEYRQDGDTVDKYRCHRGKTFDGRESYWYSDEKLVDSWNVKDSNMPDWLRRYTK